VLLVTGHDPEALDEHLPDAAIAAAETIVVLMGGETRRAARRAVDRSRQVA
jgi:siroheme synthase